jgi:hypothetical protein
VESLDEGGEPIFTSRGETRRTRCSNTIESGFYLVDKRASLSPQPNVVALRSRTGAITIDARE